MCVFVHAQHTRDLKTGGKNPPNCSGWVRAPCAREGKEAKAKTLARTEEGSGCLLLAAAAASALIEMMADAIIKIILRTKQPLGQMGCAIKIAPLSYP